MPPLVKYTLIRVGLFAAALALLLIVGIPGWIAAIAAALLALSIAYIFFRQQRDEAIAAVRKSPGADDRASDEQAEDN